ncbi:MAG: PCRF domain-containing protein [Hyphomonas sp.]
MGAATEPPRSSRSKEHAELKPVVDKQRELIARPQGAGGGREPCFRRRQEMAELAEMEIEELRKAARSLEQEMVILLLLKDVDDTADIVLEVRSATPAATRRPCLVGDLFRMYCATPS